MKILLILLCLIVCMEYSFAQTESAPDGNTKTIMLQSDSLKTSPDTSVHKEYNRNLSIKVNPKGASDASVSLVRVRKILFAGAKKTIEEMNPDTLGIFKAPLSMAVPTGFYYIEANKEGYGKLLREYEIGSENEYNLKLELNPLKDLSKKNPWNTVRWISAAVAVGAGAVSYYIYSKHKAAQDEYNNVTTLDGLKDKRDIMSSYSNSFQISTGIAFAAVGSFVMTYLFDKSTEYKYK